MKQQKDNWVKILFSFAAPCKGKMALSVFCAILSVAGGFIPFWAVYEILLAFINQNVTLNGILIWCLVGAVATCCGLPAMESLRSWRIFQPIPFWKESGLKLRTG